MALPATEDFSVTNNPLTTSADWGQAGATSVDGSGQALSGGYVSARTDNNDQSAYWASDSFNAAQSSQITIVTVAATSGRMGLILRGGSGNEAFLVRYRFTTPDKDFECFYWNSGGSRIQIGTAFDPAADLVNGDKFKITIDADNLISLFIDTGSGFPETADNTWDATGVGPSVGAPGVYVVNTITAAPIGDDWEGGNLVSPSPIFRRQHIGFNYG